MQTLTELIKITRSDHILHLVMNRPEKKNALTDAMYGVLADALEAAETDGVRVVLLRGEGDMFTSGNDVADFAAAKPGVGGLRNVTRFITAIARSTCPLVAAAQGRAVGIGATLLLHCDYVVLAQDAQLIAPFVNLGLVPEAASSLLLPARIGHVRAFATFALGEPIAAHEALEWGLANKVVPTADLVSTAHSIAKRLALQPAGALRATKALMRDAAAVSSKISVESAEFAARLVTPEAKEAFAAFAERRAPDFSKFQ